MRSAKLIVYPPKFDIIDCSQTSVLACIDKCFKKEDIVLHKDENYLRDALTSGKNSRDIAKDLHVSYKLIEIYLEKYAIPFKSMAPVVNKD